MDDGVKIMVPGINSLSRAFWRSPTEMDLAEQGTFKARARLGRGARKRRTP